MSPAGGRPGRFDGLRTAWLVAAQAAADRAGVLLAAAGLAAADPKRAVDCLNRAEALLAGRAEAAPAVDAAAAARAWSEASGIDWSDPGAKERVYKAIAEARRRELEGQGKLAARRADALAKAKRFRPGRFGGPKSG